MPCGLSLPILSVFRHAVVWTLAFSDATQAVAQPSSDGVSSRSDLAARVQKLKGHGNQKAR